MENILVLDFGGQYNQLIARRIREANIYCEVLPYHVSIERILSYEPKGIILTGGPSSVTDANALKPDQKLFSLGIPILGICYGMQLMGHMLGGHVTAASHREYGKTNVQLDTQCPLFRDMPCKTTVWMSHGHMVQKMPEGFALSAGTNNCEYAAMYDANKKLYGVQFHPEVNHTPLGMNILKNFLYDICGCRADWKMESYVEHMIQTIRTRVKDGRVLCAMSGGVDSSVAALLVHRAIGDQLRCIFVDHGFMRKGEPDYVERVFTDRFHMNLIRVDASNRFIQAIQGVKEPEEKRKIIGREFIRVFEEEAKKIGYADYLVQGTIYPDVIESGLGDAAVIKSHHNVGGLPEQVDFQEIIEPLRFLFKDEVRSAGSELGLPDAIVHRQPFPGPGLAIRVIGAVTREKLSILREADHIFTSELEKSGVVEQLNQYFAVLTDMRSVGVMGDERTYEYTVALRAVTTTDFMTADWARIPWDVMENISNRIVNEVANVNRIVYDVTGKPPATIEWE